MKKSVVIKMKENLEARPIANLIQMANTYACQIYLETGGKRVNAKSIMGMMSLALMNGDEVVLDADGTDAEEAVAELTKFLTK